MACQPSNFSRDSREYDTVNSITFEHAENEIFNVKNKYEHENKGKLNLYQTREL
jgi:hypothetical protein